MSQHWPDKLNGSKATITKKEVHQKFPYTFAIVTAKCGNSTTTGLGFAKCLTYRGWMYSDRLSNRADENVYRHSWDKWNPEEGKRIAMERATKDLLQKLRNRTKAASKARWNSSSEYSPETNEWDHARDAY